MTTPIRWRTRYPVQRVKVRELEARQHYALRPLGEIRTVPVDAEEGRWPWHRVRPGDDALWFPAHLGNRSLHSELAAWLTHAGTGRPMARKRWSSNTTLHALPVPARGAADTTVGFAVRLHETDVVTVDPSDVVTLRTGGWPTMTTSARVEDFLPEGWSIEKQGSKLPWVLWTTARRVCGRCGDELHDEPAPDGTACWVDTSGGGVCSEDEWSAMMGEPNQHYPRPAHEIVMSEGMCVNLRTGLLVTAGDEIIMSWPRDYHHGRSWQARAYG